MENRVTEQELQAKAKGRRVTEAELEANIVHEIYASGGEIGRIFGRDISRVGPLPDSAASLPLLTICVLVLKNGYTVLGKSACADPANFDRDIGERLARADAIRQVWPLMGYALREQLAWEASLLGSMAFKAPDHMVHIGTKVVVAKPMTRREYNDLRGWALPDNEDGNDEGYLVEYTDRVENPPHVPGFRGYVSWSPKEVFERAYRRVGQAAPAAPGPEAAGVSDEPDFIQRLRQELQEVSERRDKLKAFLPTAKAAALNRLDRQDLIEQLDIMNRYVNILTLRLRRLTWDVRNNPFPT